MFRQRIKIFDHIIQANYGEFECGALCLIQTETSGHLTSYELAPLFGFWSLVSPPCYQVIIAADHSPGGHRGKANSAEEKKNCSEKCLVNLPRPMPIDSASRAKRREKALHMVFIV